MRLQREQETCAMQSNRKATNHEHPLIPDEFTLTFRRVPGGGWVVSGDSSGKGHYAYEAFSDAFCRMPQKPVPTASHPSRGTDAKVRRGKRGGGR
jgi:hypothetical protein